MSKCHTWNTGTGTVDFTFSKTEVAIRTFPNFVLTVSLCRRVRPVLCSSLASLDVPLSPLGRSSVQRIKNLAHRWSSGSHSDAPFCNYCRFCRDINDMSRHLPVLLKVTYVTCLMSCLDICLHVHDMWHRHLPIKKRFVRKTQYRGGPAKTEGRHTRAR